MLRENSVNKSGNLFVVNTFLVHMLNPCKTTGADCLFKPFYVLEWNVFEHYFDLVLTNVLVVIHVITSEGDVHFLF